MVTPGFDGLVRRVENDSVVCEQLLFTSASETLEGPGYGVVGHSRGWPVDIGRRTRQLGEIVAFLEQGASIYVADGHPPPTSLSYSRPHNGALVVRKSLMGSDEAGRPANYLVHALWDASGVLGARHALALWNGEEFRSTPLGDEWRPDADLDQVRVALRTADVDQTTVREVVANERLRVLLELSVESVLQQQRTQRPFVLTVPEMDLALDWLNLLLLSLPSALADATTFTTFTKDPGAVPYDVCVAYSPFSNPVKSRRANVADLGRYTAKVEERSPDDHRLARHLVESVAQRRSERAIPQWITSSSDAERWLSAHDRLRDGAVLTTDDLWVLAGPDPDRSWLTDADRRKLVIDALGSARVAEKPFLAALTGRAARLSDHEREELLRLGVSAFVRANLRQPDEVGRPLWDVLAAADPKGTLPARVARACVAALFPSEARPDSGPVLLGGLGPHLLAAIDRLSSHNVALLATVPTFVDLALAGKSWASFHDHLLRGYFEAPTPQLRSVVLTLVSEHPVGFGRSVRQLRPLGAKVEHALVELIAGSDFRQVRAIVAAALEAGCLRPGTVLNGLICSPLVPTDMRRWLLQEYWAPAARQAGLPEDLVDLVQPRRTPVRVAAVALVRGRGRALGSAPEGTVAAVPWSGRVRHDEDGPGSEPGTAGTTSRRLALAVAALILVLAAVIIGFLTIGTW